MKSKIIYCIPGLGLNGKIFKKLNIPSAELKFIDFIEPHKNESITNYSTRLAEQISDDNFSLLGMSLGGIIAIEIAEIKKVEHLFLISTIKNKTEIPKLITYLDKIPSGNTAAAKLAVKTTVKLKPFYDNSDEEGIQLFKEMLEETSLEMITWGWKVVSKWPFNKTLTTPFYHLHGTADLVFPIKNIDQAETLKGGTHYMIYNNAAEVSKRIEQYLRRN